MSLPQADESAEHAGAQKTQNGGRELVRVLTLGDDVLRARGIYATLSAERREQLRRLQAICATLVSATNGVIRDAEKMPPETMEHLMVLENCVANAKDARERIASLSSEMVELKVIAWAQ